LDTLVRLRWMAVAGQSAAVICTQALLNFNLPLWYCLVVIAAAALLNIVLRLFYPLNERLSAGRATASLAFDVVQLAALLYLTGGLQNPFSLLLLAPVLISATTLPPGCTLFLGALTIACSTLLTVVHLALPWATPQGLVLPFLYVCGIWTAVFLAVIFIGVFAWRVTEEARQLSKALAATELVLAHEHHLSALDGLAAAAAHELGTPLATITLVARELDRAVPASSPLKEDLTLLREQVERCRGILKTLTTLNEEGGPNERISLNHLLEEVTAPHRNFGVSIQFDMQGDHLSEPQVRHNPGLTYGLGNFIENAMDFAKEKVDIKARWSISEVELHIIDDGPGFAPDVLARLGEPYVTTRAAVAPLSGGGLGLGIFIAKTLLERSGATVTFINRVGAATAGAEVYIVWPRAVFERDTKTPLA
jgi:two-component system sensor histidine kinase RegB